MIEIQFDPYNGKAVPDGRVDDLVNYIVRQCNKSGDAEPNFTDNDASCFSTENMIIGLRLAVVEGKINHKHIIFLYNIPGTRLDEFQTITCDKQGMLSHWPEGFCDYNTNQTFRLLEGRLK